MLWRSVQPEFDRLFDVLAGLLTSCAPGVTALEGRHVDVEAAIFIGLEDDFKALD